MCAYLIVGLWSETQQGSSEALRASEQRLLPLIPKKVPQVRFFPQKTRLEAMDSPLKLCVWRTIRVFKIMAVVCSAPTCPAGTHETGRGSQPPLIAPKVQLAPKGDCYLITA